MPVSSPFPTALIDDSFIPDRVAEVDLITAEDVNNMKAGIRDISSVLGINPQGNSASVAERLGVIGGIANMPTILTVAPSGAEFDTIADAIDSISDNSVNKQYVIQLYPGNYPDEIWLKPYVHLVGVQPEMNVSDNLSVRQVSIVVDGWSPFYLDNAENNIIQNIHIQVANAPMFTMSTPNYNGSSVVFNRCSLIQQTSNTPILAGPSSLRYILNNSIMENKGALKDIAEFTGDNETFFRLKAFRSQIIGNINVTELDAGGVDIRLYHSQFDGMINSNGGCNKLHAYYSYLKSATHDIVNFKATDYGSVHSMYSAFNNPSDKLPIKRSSGTQDIELYAIFSSFTTSPGEGVVSQFDPTLNITGIALDSHFDLFE